MPISADLGGSTNSSRTTVQNESVDADECGTRYLPPSLESEREIFDGFVTILLAEGEADHVRLGECWDAKQRMEQTLQAYETETQDRVDQYSLEEDWYTPSGQRRHSPRVIATVTNSALNKYRQINKPSLEEAKAAAEEQIRSWKVLESKKRRTKGREVFQSIAQQAAETLDLATNTQWDAAKTILSCTIEEKSQVDLKSYYDNRPYQEFKFDKRPEEPVYTDQPERKTIGFLEKIFPPLKRWYDGEHQSELAEIGWEDFEHLVRELFSRLFTREGADVRVTQSSGDGGVDAIAFDPDPIRGGKYVIQAKRYTKVVPVSAVRDLFGTMMSEGSSKGILVTTSHYGSDSWQFIKDKPITLIDGQNLVHLLEEHGYSVRIDVKAARKNQARNPLAR